MEKDKEVAMMVYNIVSETIQNCAGDPIVSHDWLVQGIKRRLRDRLVDPLDYHHIDVAVVKDRGEVTPMNFFTCLLVAGAKVRYKDIEGKDTYHDEKLGYFTYKGPGEVEVTVNAPMSHIKVEFKFDNKEGDL